MLDCVSSDPVFMEYIMTGNEVRVHDLDTEKLRNLIIEDKQRIKTEFKKNHLSFSKGQTRQKYASIQY